jgi:phosphohistidine swiveling domain-containing protein
MDRYIAHLNSKLALKEDVAGGKGASLAWLCKNQFNIPPGFVITTKAFHDFLADTGEVLYRKKEWPREERERLRQLLNNFEIRDNLAQAILDSYRRIGGRVAVRSSMVGEDTGNISFAGQLDTMLNVEGEEELLQAVKRCWTSVFNWRLLNYMNEREMNLPHSVSEQFSMAVVVQWMVDAEVAGIAFSRNPVTGSDEIVVEAVKGTADQLMRGTVTPGRWINRHGQWISKTGQDGISEEVISQVVNQTRTIAQTYGKPVDLEWVYDGKALHWVQMRRITTLDNLKVYNNKLAKEMLPGMIKPLIWSTNTHLVNSAWVNLLTEVIGPNNIDPHSLTKPFYYRAYFNMGAFGEIFQALGLPADALEMMMGVQAEGVQRPKMKLSRQSMRHLPRMTRFAMDKWNFASKVETFVRKTRAEYQTFETTPVDPLDETALVAEIEKLWQLTQQTAYYNIVTPLLLGIYNAMLRGRLKKVSRDLTDIDLTQGMHELDQFYPNTQLKKLHEQFSALDENTREKIKSSAYAEFRQISNLTAFQNAVDSFIRQFGHLSDSGNDFSYVPWRENPDRILKMIVNYASTASASRAMADFKQLKMGGMDRWMANAFYQRARKFRYYREAVSGLYTYGYGLFRIYFLALGERFVRRGLLASREDIMFLYLDEVKQAVNHPELGKDYPSQVAQRKKEMQEYQNIAVPSVVCGNQTPPIETTTGNRLLGTPTSVGSYKGPVRLVRGINDFDKVKAGDVLVVSHSDVGWTPLFSRAGAVIAESGGMLSHSSIVAREYGIPAVVSVNNACLLKDDTIVTVNGHNGEIIIHDEESNRQGEFK